jgi:integrase
VTETWSVTIAAPRPEKRERWARLIARGRVDGQLVVEKQSTNRTKGIDPGNRAALEAAAASWLAELQSGDVDTRAPAAARTMLWLVDVRRTSLEADPEASPNTVRGYQNLRKAVEAIPLGGVLVTELRVPHVIQGMADLARGGEDGPRAPSTVRQMVSQLAAAWRWAKDAELVVGEWPKPPRRRTRSGQTTTTRKRGYTDAELARILAWIRGYQGGRWLPLFQLAADTGQRIGALLGLRGARVRHGAEPEVEFREQWVRGAGSKPDGWRPLKTRDVVTTPIPPSTAALLPRVGPDELLWPNRRDRSRPASPRTVLRVLYRAIIGAEIPDPERLDVHSLRRAWVGTAKRRRIPDVVGMQVTGHSTRGHYDGYARNAVGDDLRAAVMAVHEARELAPTGAPTAEGFDYSARLDLRPKTDLNPKSSEPASTPSPRALSIVAAVGAGRRKAKRGAQSRAQLAWGRDPDVAALAAFADAHPEAMRRLLRDEALRVQFKSALDAIVPEEQQGEARRAGGA